MDNISNNSSSSPWDLQMSMGGNQFPFDRHSPLELLHQQQQRPPTLDPSSAAVVLPVPHLINSATTFPPPATAHMEFGGREENDDDEEEEEEEETLGAMKEMMYRIAAMQPVDIDPATIKKPRRRNVRISDEPQSVAARLRRERISERIRILQRLVPGGTKMDTASMLDEAIRYVKFLKRQVHLLQANASHPPPPPPPSPAMQWSARPLVDARVSSSSSTSSGLGFGFHEHHHHPMH